MKMPFTAEDAKTAEKFFKCFSSAVNKNDDILPTR
jgi:hypothetical protein